MTKGSKLRIIAGELGGRYIEGAAGRRGIRPMLERVRGSVFDILGGRLSDARVLDLCAGTGSLGLEALSRGASMVLFVERELSHVRLITRNVESLGVDSRTEIRRGDLPKYLRRLKGTFDLVFIDPPFRSDITGDVLECLRTESLIASGGLVVVQRDRRSEPLSAPHWNVSRRHTIGDSELWFLEEQNDD